MRVTLKSLLLVSLLLTAVSLAGVRAYGQGGATGAINLAVEDSSGGWVAAADVQVIDLRTDMVARKVQTGADGTITITLLPPGTYRIVVNKAGFAEARVSNINVRVTETTSLTIALKAGSVTEKVEITAEVMTINTTSATTGESIGATTVRTLPLATQNFQQLLTLSGGAQSDLNASGQLGRGDVRIIVNGQREDNNNYLIEGITATDYNVAELTNTPLPNPDVIQEFKVQTSLYDASQGRNGGGNVNAILKSGTKEFHGDAYEFFRNDKLNANEFFQNAGGNPRPVLKQNIFGVSAGGPVGTEKMGFFFFNYQGTRQRSGLSPGTLISTTLPVLPADRSMANLANVFFEDPNVALDPVAVALLNFKSDQFGGTSNGFLIPSGDPATGAFAVSRPGKYSDNQFTANWDREFRGGSDKIATRFFFSNSEQNVPFGAGGLQASLGGSISGTDLNFPYDLPVKDRFFSIAETHLFSATLVNDFRFGLVHINNNSINEPPVTAADLGINRPMSNLTDSIYKFTLFSSGYQMGPTPMADQFQEQNNYNFVDNLSWVHGAHVFRFGGDLALVKLDKLFPQVFNGQLFFVSSGGLSDFQKFLLGQPDFSFGGGGVFDHKYRQKNISFFAQDDWKVRRDLTLNLGLRTELFGAFHDDACHIGNVESRVTQQGQYPWVYPSCASSLGVAGFTGSGSASTFRNETATGYGPRFGLAWDVLNHHTTTVRGGYGIYYAREDVGVIDQLSFQSPLLPIVFFNAAGPLSMTNFFAPCSPSNPAPENPWCAAIGSNPNALPPAGTIDPFYIPCLSTLQGFPGNDTTQAGTYQCSGPGVRSDVIFALEVPRDFKVPSTQQWNLTIQRSLGKQWVLEVGYIGTHSVHLRETRDGIQSRRASVANPVVVTDAFNNTYQITTNTFGNAIARTPTPGLNGYSGYQLFANDAYSHYHALQATVSRRWARGYFQSAYTWSKSTDATSTGNTAFNTAYNDQSNINASRGLSDFDRKHRLVVSYVYDLPFFEKEEGWKHAVLANWSISGITIFQSGTPFSIFDSAAGTGFLGAGSTPLLGASLASGGSIAQGYTSGDVHARLNGYVDSNNFTAAPLLYPVQCALDGNFCTTDFGNLGRNIYRGPRQQNWDFSLIKNFKIGERQTIRFTADFFNIWNHVNFSNPTFTDVESPGNFGQITTTKGTPRLIQFSLRWAF
jgi:hypothetical protein